MTRAYNDMASLAKSYEPDVEKMNNQILSGVASDLERQARLLLADINSLWQGYENSYKNPAVYVRTGRTKTGFSISNSRYKMNADGTVTMEIDLVLDDGSMWHNSVLGRTQPQGHSFMLISEGWIAEDLESYLGRSIDRFTRYDGYGIVDTLIRAYNTSEYEFKFYYEGEEYGGKGDRRNFSFTR